MEHIHSDAALAELRRKLCGDAVEIAVFTKSGEAHVFTDVDPHTISFSCRTGVNYLRFKVSEKRTVVVPNVAYWTEQD